MAHPGRRGPGATAVVLACPRSAPGVGVRPGAGRGRAPLRWLGPLLVCAVLAGCGPAAGRLGPAGEGAAAHAPRGGGFGAMRPAGTAPSGFSADTRGPAGLASGARASEAACIALPDGVWVSTGRRQECLRVWRAGPVDAGETAVVFIPGDPPGATYMAAGGEPRITGMAGRESLPPPQRMEPSSRHFPADAPAFVIARPGMGGSSGHHARDRHTHEEIRLVDGALSQLRQRFGLRAFALAGFSSGGAIVAGLLGRRADIRCAVMDSAPLDLAAFYGGPDGRLPDHVAMRGDLADPMRMVGGLRTAASIWVIGDPRDRNVPPWSWSGWSARARQQGNTVFELRYVTPTETMPGRDAHHHDWGLAQWIAGACAAGLDAEAIRATVTAHVASLVRTAP